MKKLLLACLLFAGPAFAAETEQPPYAVKDPAVDANFRELYLLMAQHQHNKDGSSRLAWIPFANDATREPTANNTAPGDGGIYMHSSYLVIFYNAAGVMKYLKIPVDGATTAWTTGAP